MCINYLYALLCIEYILYYYQVPFYLTASATHVTASALSQCIAIFIQINRRKLSRAVAPFSESVEERSETHSQGGKGRKRERGGNGEKKVRKKGEDKKVFGTGLQKQKNTTYLYTLQNKNSSLTTSPKSQILHCDNWITFIL